MKNSSNVDVPLSSPYIATCDGCFVDTSRVFIGTDGAIEHLEWTPPLNPDEVVDVPTGRKLVAECTLNGGGWKTPNIYELLGLIDYRLQDPASSAPGVESVWYITDGDDPSCPGDALFVSGQRGRVFGNSHSIQGCVRGCRRVRANHGDVRSDDEFKAHCLRLVRKREPVRAIREWRTRYGTSLVEARNAVLALPMPLDAGSAETVYEDQPGAYDTEGRAVVRWLKDRGIYQYEPGVDDESPDVAELLGEHEELLYAEIDRLRKLLGWPTQDEVEEMAPLARIKQQAREAEAQRLKKIARLRKEIARLEKLKFDA